MSKSKYTNQGKILYKQITASDVYKQYEENLDLENFSAALTNMDIILSSIPNLTPELYAELRNRLIEPVTEAARPPSMKNGIISPEDYNRYNEARTAIIKHSGLAYPSTNLENIENGQQSYPKINPQEEYDRGLEELQRTPLEMQIRTYEKQKNWQGLIQAVSQITQDMKAQGMPQESISEIEGELLSPLANAVRNREVSAERAMRDYTAKKLESIETEVAKNRSERSTKGLLKMLKAELNEVRNNIEPTKKRKISSLNTETDEIAQEREEQKTSSPILDIKEDIIIPSRPKKRNAISPSKNIKHFKSSPENHSIKQSSGNPSPSLKNPTGEERLKRIYTKLLTSKLNKKEDELNSLIEQYELKTYDFGINKTILDEALEDFKKASTQQEIDNIALYITSLINNDFKISRNLDASSQQTAFIIGQEHPNIFDKYKLVSAQEMKQAAETLVNLRNSTEQTIKDAVQALKDAEVTTSDTNRRESIPASQSNKLSTSR